MRKPTHGASFLAATIASLIASGCVFTDLEPSPNFTVFDGGFNSGSDATGSNNSLDSGPDMAVDRTFEVTASEPFGGGNLPDARTGFDAIVDGFGVVEMTPGGSVVAYALNYDATTSMTFANQVLGETSEPFIRDAAVVFDAVFLDASFVMTIGATSSEVAGRWCRDTSQACSLASDSTFGRGSDLVLIKPQDRAADTVQYVTNDDGSGVVLGTISTTPVLGVDARDTMGFAAETSAFSAVATASGAIEMGWFSAELGSYFVGRWSDGRFSGSPSSCAGPGLSEPVIVASADGESHAMVRDGNIVIGCDDGVVLDLPGGLVVHFDIIDLEGDEQLLAWSNGDGEVWAAIVSTSSKSVTRMTRVDSEFTAAEVRAAVSEDGRYLGVIARGDRFRGYILRDDE